VTDSTITQEILAGSGLNLGQAARCFPSYRDSKPVNPSTIFRWIMSGVRLADGMRLRLEARRVGGRWLTSRQAIQRFIDEQTPRFDDDRSEPDTSRQREKTAERAGIELGKLGI
jgi:hypothetical protein